jgi:hypothetical protein
VDGLASRGEALMDTEAAAYVKKLLDLYLALPETPLRVSRHDRALALRLFQQGVPASNVEAAFLLASARRLCRPNDAPPLGAIRSLHYFLPVIEEVSALSLPHDYLRYLRHKIAILRPQNHQT